MSDDEVLVDLDPEVLEEEGLFLDEEGLGLDKELGDGDGIDSKFDAEEE